MRLVFMGSPPFAAEVLAAVADLHEVVLVVTQPDKRKGRGKNYEAPAVKAFASERGLEVFQPRSARTGELALKMRETQADAAVVVAYGKILPLEVLEALPGGCINVHASLLPAYRGAAPIQWAILDGLSVTGVSIMALDEGMDTGPVYATREAEISGDDTSGSMFEKLAPVGAELLLEVLADIEDGSACAVAQDEALATHARMLAKSDGVIDWSEAAPRVRDRIRGVDPWPSAQSRFGELALKVFGAFVSSGEGEPGEVLAIDDQAITVACAEGAIGVRELQPEANEWRRLPAPEAAASKSVRCSVADARDKRSSNARDKRS